MMKRENSASTQIKQAFPMRRSSSSQKPNILQNHDRQNIPPLVLTLGHRDGMQSKRSLTRLSDRHGYGVQYRLPQEATHNKLLKGFWFSGSESTFDLNGSKGSSKTQKTNTFIPPEYMALANEPSLLPKFLREKLKLKSRNTTRNFLGQGAFFLSPMTIKKEDDVSLFDSKPNLLISLNRNKNEVPYRSSSDPQNQAQTPSQSPETVRFYEKQFDSSPISKPTLTARTNISPNSHTNSTAQYKSQKELFEDQLSKNYNSHRTQNEDQAINSILANKKSADSSFSANIVGTIKLTKRPSHLSYKTIDLKSVDAIAEKNQDLSPSKKYKEYTEIRRKRWTSMLRVRNPDFTKTHCQINSNYETGQANSRREEGK